MASQTYCPACIRLRFPTIETHLKRVNKNFELRDLKKVHDAALDIVGLTQRAMGQLGLFEHRCKEARSAKPPKIKVPEDGVVGVGRLPGTEPF